MIIWEEMGPTEKRSRSFFRAKSYRYRAQHLTGYTFKKESRSGGFFQCCHYGMAGSWPHHTRPRLIAMFLSTCCLGRIYISILGVPWTSSKDATINNSIPPNKNPPASKCFSEKSTNCYLFTLQLVGFWIKHFAAGRFFESALRSWWIFIRRGQINQVRIRVSLIDQMTVFVLKIHQLLFLYFLVGWIEFYLASLRDRYRPIGLLVSKGQKVATSFGKVLPKYGRSHWF